MKRVPPAKVKAPFQRPDRPSQATEEDGPCCQLCAARLCTQFASVGERDYYSCSACGLAFLDPAQRPTWQAELAEYWLHQNDPSDAAYRAFLARLVDPLVRYLSPGASGLDYGCGPGPTLSVMMEERGFSMRIWDPFFRPDATALARRYDFITCSEAAEHFHEPAREFRRLDSLLRPGGRLGIMTGLLRPELSFAEWHYVHEVSHVCFYRPMTMSWIARKHGWAILFSQGNVVIFRKKVSAE